MIHKRIILVLFVIFWIILAFFNVFYNSVKTVSEVHEWSPLSTNQKLQKIFGTSYEFSVFIAANTTRNAKILFYSETGMPYFYARYYLYPRHLYWYQVSDAYVKSKFPRQFDYIALYNMNTSFKEYEKVATFSYSGVLGSLYKRK